jgi:hypothetical protein
MPRGVTSRQTDESLLKVRRVTLTASEVKALATSPKELIPAPGPGKIVQVISAFVHNPAANSPLYTTQYTESSINPVIEYGGGTDITAALEGTSGAVVSATEKYQAFVFANSATTVYAMEENAKVQLLSPSGDFAAGTNPIYVYITYRILDTDTGASGFIEEA